MSQAAELLNSLSNDSVATYTASIEEEHIVIGDDRVIRIPDSLKRIAVQYDHDIETVTFDCPRYWDNHDMSQMIIYINYLLPNGTKGQYRAKNVTAVGRIMSFDWTISNNLTQHKGSISFLVCVVKTDADGNEERHWNSELNQEVYVSEGLECAQVALTRYPDIITHLLTRMEEVEAIATPEAMQTYTDTWLEENHARILAEIEAKGAATLATIPEAYTETYNMAKESVRTKADAIVCTAEGSIVAVSDSSDDHICGLRVFGKTTQVTTTGKNLFDPECLINAGWSKYNETYYGQSSLLTDLVPDITFKADTQYTISTYGHGTSSGDVTIFIYVYYTDETWSTAIKIAASSTPAYYTYTTAEGKTVDRIRFSYGYNQNTSLWNTMIEEGTVATKYEPYSAGVASPSPDYLQALNNIDSGEAVVVSVAGKNLAANATSRVATLLNGITFTITKDSSEFIIGGTQDGTKDASGNLVENLTLMPGTYTLSVTGLCTPDYINVQRMTGNRRYEAVGVTQKAPKTFTITEKTVVLIQMVVYSTSTYNNTTLTLQLEEGSEATVYEPHKAKQELAATYVLSGIPVDSGGNYTDFNGQQWICDEVDFERGMYIQRVKAVECDGTETITREERSDGTYRFIIRFATPVQALTEHVYDGKCSHFVYGHSPIGNNAEDKMMCVWTTGNAYCRHDGIASEDDMVTWLAEQHAAGTPVTTTYPLAIPVETPLTAEELEAFKVLKTNHPHTTVMNDAGAHMELSYNADTKTYFDNGIKQTVTDVLEAIENGSY